VAQVQRVGGDALPAAGVLPAVVPGAAGGGRGRGAGVGERGVQWGGDQGPGVSGGAGRGGGLLRARRPLPALDQGRRGRLRGLRRCRTRRLRVRKPPRRPAGRPSAAPAAAPGDARPQPAAPVAIAVTMAGGEVQRAVGEGETGSRARQGRGRDRVEGETGSACCGGRDRVLRVERRAVARAGLRLGQGLPRPGAPCEG
jgi:hypothetical protein